MSTAIKCSKKSYLTRSEAKAAKKQVNKTRKWGITNIYWCDDCRAYHLTTMAKEASRNKTRHLNKKYGKGIKGKKGFRPDSEAA